MPASSGGLVVAARDGVYLTAPDGSEAVTLDPVKADVPSNRMNDANIDPAGRLWAGTMAFDFTRGAASLYRIDGTTGRRVLDGLTISNGIDWSPDGTLVYFIDSGTYRVDIMDFDVSSGEVHDRRPFAELRSPRVCRTALPSTPRAESGLPTSVAAL